MAGSCWAILLAAGKDQEFSGGADAAFLGIGSRPALACVAAAAEACKDVDGLVVVAPKDRMEMIGPMGFRFGLNKIRAAIPGVGRQMANLLCAWERVADRAEWVVILEATRPMVTSDMISETLQAARRTGGAVMVSEIVDPIRVAVRKGIHESVSAKPAWSIQSPMAFSADIFRKLLALGAKKKSEEVDLVEQATGLGCAVRLVPSPHLNLRVRTADDLAVAAYLTGEKRV